MSLATTISALLPVFFILMLGYAAGRYHGFNADQATGFNQLATNFAMPASLFSYMLQLDRPTLVQQGPLLLVLLAAHLGLFGLLYLALRGRFGLSPVAVILLALALASSSAAVYGAAVLRPVAGASSAGAVGLVALVINLLVPVALFLLEKASSQAPAAGQPSPAAPAPASLAGQKPAATNAAPAPPKPAASVGAALGAAATSPLLLAPLLGVALVLFKLHLPALLLSPLSLLGQLTTGLATFAVGLTLAAHQISVSRVVVLGTLARLTIQPALILGLLLVFGVHSELGRATVIASALPVGVLQTLLASRYHALEKELPSMLLFTTLGMVAALPAWAALTSWLLPN